MMLGRICLGLSLPFLLGMGSNDLPKSWKAITCEDGKFKVFMPTEPTKTSQQVATASAQFSVKMLVAEGRHDALFVVSYTDVPEADLKKVPVEKRLNQARDGAVSAAGGMLRSEQVIKLKKYSGRDLVIEKKGKPAARVRIFLVNRRLYQVIVLGAAPPRDVSIFLDSFALIE